MSYHRFSNLSAMFQADLSTKLLEKVRSMDFMKEECNCSSKTKTDGLCSFKAQCLHKCVIYGATCKVTNKIYIRSTQGKLKTRMNLHNQEVRRMDKCGRISDSCAKHFAALYPAKSATFKHIRSLMTVKVLWEGNPLSVSKTFGKLKCSLCMKERILILK